MPEPVPTAHDLVRMGLEYAEAVAWSGKKDGGVPTIVRITDKGHAHIGDIMRRNAAEALAQQPHLRGARG